MFVRLLKRKKKQYKETTEEILRVIMYELYAMTIDKIWLCVKYIYIYMLPQRKPIKLQIEHMKMVMHKSHMNQLLRLCNAISIQHHIFPYKTILWSFYFFTNVTRVKMDFLIIYYLCLCLMADIESIQ